MEEQNNVTGFFFLNFQGHVWIKRSAPTFLASQVRGPCFNVAVLSEGLLWGGGVTPEMAEDGKSNVQQVVGFTWDVDCVEARKNLDT